EKLASAREIHAGIVFIEEGDLDRTGQLAVLIKVFERLAGEKDLVNRALRVAVDGTMTIEEAPAR
ncbi:hypothetical protein Q8G81_33590, partial [Klebsiella pneumoniae]